MSPPVEIPEPRRDRPGLGGLAVVAAVGLGVGIALAGWASAASRARPEPTGEDPREAAADARARGADPRAASAPTHRGSDRDPRGAAEGSPADDTDEGGDDERGDDERGAIEAAAQTDAVEADEADTAGAEPAARDADGHGTSATSAAATTDERGGEGGASGAETESAADTTGPESADGAAGSLRRIVPGQVAYLRCDGVMRGRRCPRDEALEVRVFEVAQELLTCAAPPRGPGWADIRLDFAGDAAPEVGWRDTFAADVSRLDREATLACLRPSLTPIRHGLGASRLLFSFRFRAE